MLTIHTRKLLIIDYRGLQFRLDVTHIRGFSPGTVHLERATQTCYLFSASQRNPRRAVCLSPPLLNRVSWKPVTHLRNMWRSNGSAIRGNDDLCSSVVQRSNDGDCSDWKLPSFLLVSHGRIAWTCAYSLPFHSYASSFTIARTHWPRPPFNRTLHLTCWKASHYVSSLVELFGPW